MLKIIPYRAEITCDICGKRDEGDSESFFRSGWALMRATMEGPKSFHEMAICHGCLYVMRFRDKANHAMYSNKHMVIKFLEDES